MTGGDLMLLARTAARLHPGQLTQRARLRGQRLALRRSRLARRWLLAGPDPAAAVGWPAGFRPLDAQLWAAGPGLGELPAGRIELLGMTRTVAEPAGCWPDDPADGDVPAAHWTQADWAAARWAQPDAPALWRYHLHYWDWAWALAAAPDRADARAAFGTMFRSWLAARPAGQGDAWHPYPAALRAWSFCGLHRDLMAGAAAEDRFLASLSVHAGFLRRHLESDVGGNHLVKNLKALAGLAVFFGDGQLLDWALSRLASQLPIQVLPDGGHYERAPAYHCQVLADLVDVAGLVRAAGREPAPELTRAIARMRSWLGRVLTPGGRVPLLNDGYPVPARLLRLLQPDPAPPDPLVLLPDTGLVRATAGPWHLLADIGPPGPGRLPAHAHADTFSCLLHLGDIPLLVDTGTSTYAAGPVRSHERSTAAHNTVEVDGTDSTEVWGAFRAARRARVTEVTVAVGPTGLTIAASHDGFRRLPGRPRHRRRWRLTEAGLRVEDSITGRGRHSIAVHWHCAPGSRLRLVPGGAVVQTQAGEVEVAISASGPVTVAAEAGPVAAGFGHTVAAPVLTCRIRSALPVQVGTTWRRAAPTSHAGPGSQVGTADGSGGAG